MCFLLEKSSLRLFESSPSRLPLLSQQGFPFRDGPVIHLVLDPRAVQFPFLSNPHLCLSVIAKPVLASSTGTACCYCNKTSSSGLFFGLLLVFVVVFLAHFLLLSSVFLTCCSKSEEATASAKLQTADWQIVLFRKACMTICDQ